jgi:hypothetical protein
MTPAEARTLGDRWRFLAGVFLGFAVTLAVLDLGNLSWLSVVVSLVCTRQMTEHYAWRRGYLAGKSEARHAARMAGGRRG